MINEHNNMRLPVIKLRDVISIGDILHDIFTIIVLIYDHSQSFFTPHESIIESLNRSSDLIQ